MINMLWEDFINSYWRDWRTGDKSKERDRLDEPDWIKQWLKHHALAAADMPDPEELEKLKTLRSYLFSLVQSVVQTGTGQLQDLNAYMAKGPVIRQIVTGADGQTHISLVPQGFTWPEIMAEIAASFAGTLADKEPSRFRICDNPDCLWVYYDDTRNRSKRYCDDKACGNLMKVRRFRARKKAESTEK